MTGFSGGKEGVLKEHKRNENKREIESTAYQPCGGNEYTKQRDHTIQTKTNPVQKLEKVEIYENKIEKRLFENVWIFDQREEKFER